MLSEHCCVPGVQPLLDAELSPDPPSRSALDPMLDAADSDAVEPWPDPDPVPEPPDGYVWAEDDLMPELGEDDLPTEAEPTRPVGPRIPPDALEPLT